MFKTRSVHSKFLFLLLGLTVIPVIIALGIFEWIHYQDSYNKLLNKLDILSSSQSLLLAEPLWNNDPDQIIINSATLIADPDVISVRILNSQNTPIYSYGHFSDAENPLFRKRAIKYVNDIQVETIGSIELGLTNKHITTDIKQRLFERGLILTTFLFIIICAYASLQFTVGKALKKLLHSIKRAEEDDVLVPVNWDSNDEIGHVINAYNSMQAQQKQDADKLHQAHTLLEQRVEDRTRLLSQEILIREKIELKLRKQDQELQTFLNGVPVMLWMLETDGKTMHYNDSWLKFTGLSRLQEEQLGWNGSDIHQDYRQQCIQTYQTCIKQKKPFSQEYLKQNGKGKFRWISETGLPRYDEDGHYLGYFGTCVDITPRKKAERLLFEEKERVQITLTSIGEGVITTNADCNVQFINPVAERLLGYSLKQVIGNPLSSVLNIIDEITREPIENPSTSCLKQQQTINRKDAVLLLNRNGQEYYIKDTTALIFDQKKQIIGTVLVFVDVTESKKLSKQLSYQACHDPLTGLVNRREFESNLQRILDSFDDTSDEHAIYYMDLDQFKIINDTCGHFAGDELLRQITGLLKHLLRKRDILARLGGDEFGVLMENCTLLQAQFIAEKLCNAVKQFRFVWEGKSFHVGVSIGLVAITNQASDLKKLLIDADSACYAAKSSGRGRVHVFHENDTSLTKRFGEMQWTTRINRSLDDNKFCLYFQPIYSLQENLNTHCELLLRMIGDDGEIISPESFLPAAEKYNLIQDIDHWVVTNAFAWIASLSSNDSSIRHFGINLSGQTLSDDLSIDFIIKQSHKHNLSFDNICFEITETAIIENLSFAIKSIKRLKELGCKFALDDFGSGVSSFAYLKQLPVDYLKIDGFFVKEMNNNPIDLEMVRSIHNIGQIMGKKTIAEFVENDASLQHLHDIGIDYAQGFHLGKPQPIKDFK